MVVVEGQGADHLGQSTSILRRQAQPHQEQHRNEVETDKNGEEVNSRVWADDTR